MKKTEMYICSMINSVKAADGFGGYVLVYEKDGKPLTLDEVWKLEKATKTTSELMLIAQALSCYREPCEITVHVNQTQTIKALSEWIHAWEQNDWKNARGEAVSPWYKAISTFSKGHLITYTADKGEFTAWLTDQTRKGKEKVRCLITLENLTAPKSSTGQQKA